MNKRDRFIFLRKLFDKFKKNFERKWPGTVLEISDRVVFSLVNSMSDDVERMQNYHGIKHKDDIKRAAFMVKWILRTRPVFSNNHNGHGYSDKLVLANEMFAVFAALSVLEWPVLILSEVIWKNCYYTLHYRNFEEGLFMLFLQAIRPTTPGAATAVNR